MLCKLWCDLAFWWPIFSICSTFFLYGETVVLQEPFSKVDFNRTEVKQFLNCIACAEVGQWSKTLDEIYQSFPQLTKGLSIKETLNQTKVRVLESDDLDLIKLFNRAVRNHDSFSEEKANPVTHYYRHYQPPNFSIPDIHLTFDIKDNEVLVTSHLFIIHSGADSPLILDGKDQDVAAVLIDGKAILKENYKVTPHELIVLDVPQKNNFCITIKSRIDPFHNDSLEGMYQCSQWLATQCESEGARRIFFTLDRPDVLSRIKTTIIADKDKFPFRLSNGDLLEEQQLEDGRWSITWNDPIPKPSYLFACVLGKFSLLESHYTTRSGRAVQLQIYVEPGKESRAHYALFALRKAMEFDEQFFDREYDLSCLKMVAIPNFNSGAMENKGLLIFNDIRLLVDSQSGTDKSFRDVAHVVAHEYFHNWSGNRVTVRNWFEIALKEAFTDFRAMLFSEWMFGAEFIRPKAVRSLRENQFPEEYSKEGHPIMVESYVDAHAIYDSTTYTKGREVFRTLKTYIDLFIPDGFKEVQNLYFKKYDGQAVTFRELLTATNEILKRINKDVSLFERWFYQQGTPIVRVETTYNAKEKAFDLIVTQSCVHPKTGEQQQPLQIPFFVELLSPDGKVIFPKTAYLLEKEQTVFHFEASERPIPVLMHGYCAPVILQCDYKLSELGSIVKYTQDAFSRWEAGQNYSVKAIKEMISRLEQDPTLIEKANEGNLIFYDLQQLYLEVLSSSELSPLAKAQILDIPSLRILSQELNFYDFEQLNQFRCLFINQLAHVCKDSLTNLLKAYPPLPYLPAPPQMQIRELRHATFSLLALTDFKCHEELFAQYDSAKNFEELLSAFTVSVWRNSPYRETMIKDFYLKWKEDKLIFNYWLSTQALDPNCSVEHLLKIETMAGFDNKNSNHVRSLIRSFFSNLSCYHDSKGIGYHYAVDKIIEIAQFNAQLAHSLATGAFLDFEKLPQPQRALMAEEMKRLRHGNIPPQIREPVERMLQCYY